MNNQLISELQQISQSLEQVNEHLLYISNESANYTTSVENTTEKHKQIVVEHITKQSSNETNIINEKYQKELETTLNQIQQNNFQQNQLKQRVTNLKSYLNYLSIFVEHNLKKAYSILFYFLYLIMVFEYFAVVLH